MELPAEVRQAIEQELASYSTSQLARVAAALSESYRAGSASPRRRHLRSPDDVVAYAAYRLPATFAAVYSVLTEVKARLPQLQVRTCLDIGAGPGTAAWAAAIIWPEIAQITLLEREENMITMGKRLFAQSSVPALRQANWVRTDVTGSWTCGVQDLVLASYVINELSEQETEKLVARLWESTNGVLVIVEPGTPAGFVRIRQVREQLLSLGGTVVAPCPHDQLCPLAEDDWCHFSQRVNRTRLHRQVKTGQLAYEDEKFSYVCVSRQSGSKIAGRVLRHPQVRKGHIQLNLCTPEGISQMVITRKDKTRYRQAKDLKWGSAMQD